MKTIALVFSFFGAMALYGQEQILSADFGVQFSTMHMTNLNLDKELRIGTRAAFGYNYIFENQLSLGAGVRYCQRGTHSNLSFTDDAGNIIAYNPGPQFNYDYLSLPLKVGFMWGEQFRPFVHIGLLPSFLIKAITIEPAISIGETSIPERKHDVLDMVNRLDLGAFLDTGFGLKVSERFWATLMFSYNESFTSITNQDYFSEYTFRHQNMSVNIGLIFSISKPGSDVR